MKNIDLSTMKTNMKFKAQPYKRANTGEMGLVERDLWFEKSSVRKDVE